MLLAGDVGGTKTTITLFEETEDGLREVREETFLSRDHESLEEILASFLPMGAGRLFSTGCFGVAGPVIDGKSRTTNLPWQLDEQILAKTIGIRHVKLLNDLAATAYGTLHLGSADFCVLSQGSQSKEQGNIGVIAAGTGLGEAMLVWDGSRHKLVASEGGHSDFAPRSDLEIQLLVYLARKYRGHVSYERVLSGSGLFEVYTFLRQVSDTPEPRWLKEDVTMSDPNVAVTEAGLVEKDKICVQALEIFASIYGAEAGNLALKCVALGGVFVDGGIAQKILPVLEAGSFMSSFIDKGRHRTMMQRMPVKVVLNPRAALFGAAHYALRL